MIKGFKEFVTRGNLLEMAVALAIGLAVVALIQAVLENIVSPVVNSVGAGEGKSGLGFFVGDEKVGADGTFVNFVNISGLINAIIIFLGTAAAIYFLIVVPYGKYKEARGIVDEEEGPSEAELLTEIRDALRTR